MKKYLTILCFPFFLYGCSEEESHVQKEFIKFCYYGTKTRMSKSDCSCIYKDLISSSYSEQEMLKILTDDYPMEQWDSVKNKLTINILKSYKKCN